MNWESIVVAVCGQSWSWLLGVVIIVLGLMMIPVYIGWRSKTHKIGVVCLIAFGLCIVYNYITYRHFTRGFEAGYKGGSEFSTYHAAKFFTEPIPVDKLKDNVLYKPWNNMTDRNMSLVYGEDGTAFLVRGLKGIPAETIFLKRNGEIFIQSAKKTTEKK